MGVRFESLFSCVDGATPEHLLRRRLYKEIAVPLKEWPYRLDCMLLLADAVSNSPEEGFSYEPAGDSAPSEVGAQVSAKSHRLRQASGRMIQLRRVTGRPAALPSAAAEASSPNLPPHVANPVIPAERGWGGRPGGRAGRPAESTGYREGVRRY